MADKVQIKELFDELQCCVIIPTYNNAATLAQVITGVLDYTDHVIVVNDGSIDETEKILSGFDHLRIISYAKNKGKGYALRKALRYAHEEGFRYGITIDSDGQHKPSDLPLFLEKIKEEPETIIIGSRNLKQENMPGKNSFGNKFSNFWFFVETGRKLPDTQSGYRAYPLSLLYKSRFFGRKYEFELEVLVCSAWKGIKTIPIPIDVYYPPKKERISHFRPFVDFFRISVLNTILVLVAFLFVKPFSFLRALNKKKIHDFFQEEFVNSPEKDYKIIASVMVGVFFSVTPFWGWQVWIALLVALVFRLNKVITAVSTAISVLPLIPLIIYSSYVLGGLIYKHDAVKLEYSSDITLESIKINLIQYSIGSFFLGIILSGAAGLITLLLLKIFRKKSKYKDS
ncbi:MAG TPA: DUF2062 domain-containing protein [Bacteroidales bacterium]|nr:DUF2062 domain-containing protein [Bacteroidales bacterium]